MAQNYPSEKFFILSFPRRSVNHLIAIFLASRQTRLFIFTAAKIRPSQLINLRSKKGRKKDPFPSFSSEYPTGKAAEQANGS